MIWPFRRKPSFPPGPVPDWPPSSSTGPEDKRGWNEDWQVGDLAECRPGISWIDRSIDNPKPGDVLRVSALVEGLDTTRTVLVSALGFVGKARGQFWAAGAFRKLRPVIEAAEDEFTADLLEQIMPRVDASL